MTEIPGRLRVGPVIEAVDAHAAGEPGRVIVGGVTGRARRDHVRGDDLAPGQSRRPAPADAARAAWLPGRQLQPAPADLERRGRRGLRDHGAGRIPGHVRHEHDVRGDRPPRDRDPADDGAHDRAHPRIAGRADPGDRGMRRWQGPGRDLPERAGIRHPSRRPGGGAPPRHGHRGRGLRRDVLRHRRRRAVRAPAHARRGCGHRPDHRDDQGGGGRPAAGRPSRPARLRGHHHRPAVRAGPRPGQQPPERRHGLDRDARLGATGHLDRRDRPLAVRDRHVRADGDAPRARPARGRRRVPARGHPRHGLHRPGGGGDDDRGRTGRSSRASPGRHGSPASPATCSTRPTRSPTATRWATSGEVRLPRDRRGSADGRRPGRGSGGRRLGRRLLLGRHRHRRHGDLRPVGGHGGHGDADRARPSRCHRQPAVPAPAVEDGQGDDEPRPCCRTGG